MKKILELMVQDCGTDSRGSRDGPFASPVRGPKTDGVGLWYRLLGSGGEDGLVLLWDLACMSNIGAFSGNDQPVRHLSISYDSHYVAFGGDEQSVIIIQPLQPGMACPF